MVLLSVSIYRPVLLPGVFDVDVYSLLFVLLSVSIPRPVLLPGVFDVDVYSLLFVLLSVGISWPRLLVYLMLMFTLFCLSCCM